MREVVVVSAVRTAIGTFGGSLKEIPPTQLGALVVREALSRAKVDGAEVGHVVFGNVVLRSRIVAILSARSSKDSKAVFSEPMKRLRDDAKEVGRLVDATGGRRTQTLIVTDSGHVILSAVQSGTLAQRFGGSLEARDVS